MMPFESWGVGLLVGGPAPLLLIGWSAGLSGVGVDERLQVLGTDAGLRARPLRLELDRAELPGGDEPVDVAARAVELLGRVRDRQQRAHDPAAIASTTASRSGC